MKNIIGVRREDLSKKGEKRVAISPFLAEKIIQNGHKLVVQPGVHPLNQEEKRAFKDAQYQNIGANIQEDISEAHIIFGIKEIEQSEIFPNKTYVFFSHTHKGQLKNRRMLQTLMDRECTVIDYELIVDEQKRRLVTAFTYFAGYAGMLDTLWILGRRWQEEGIHSPFLDISQSIRGGKLFDARKTMTKVGQKISDEGTPANRPPVICTFLGNGKTSTGAQEIFDILPTKEIKKYELKDIVNFENRNQVYKLVLDIPDMFRLKADSPYQNQDLSFNEIINLYLKEPTHFESNLDDVLPYTTLLMNCIIWSPKYPRLLTYEKAESLYRESDTLTVVGDITCDPEGAIQFSRETWIDNPAFVYNPVTRENTFGVTGEGIAVMAVTNLPCEFPFDASSQFSQDLESMIPGIIEADYEAENHKLAGLPPSIEKAVIMWKGELTEDYEYMKEYLIGAL